MAAYITRRLLQAIPVVFLITVVSFLLMEQAPGGPSAQFAGVPRISAEEVENWLERWCLESNPDVLGILREYAGWLGVWNCDTDSLFSEQGLPNFLPQALGGRGQRHPPWGLRLLGHPRPARPRPDRRAHPSHAAS